MSSALRGAPITSEHAFQLFEYQNSLKLEIVNRFLYSTETFDSMATIKEYQKISEIIRFCLLPRPLQREFSTPHRYRCHWKLYHSGEYTALLKLKELAGAEELVKLSEYLYEITEQKTAANNRILSTFARQIRG